MGIFLRSNIKHTARELMMARENLCEQSSVHVQSRHKTNHVQKKNRMNFKSLPHTLLLLSSRTFYPKHTVKSHRQKSAEFAAKSSGIYIAKMGKTKWEIKFIPFLCPVYIR